MNANLDGFLTALGRNSAAAGVLVLLILAVQRLFGRHLAPRWHCALWLLVVVRLLPFSFSSDASIFNFLPGWRVPATASAEGGSIPDSSVQILNRLSAPPVSAGADELRAEIAPGLESAPEEPTLHFFARRDWTALVFWVWLAGAIVLVGYVASVSVSLARSLARLKPLADPAAADVLRDCCARMRIRHAPVLFECAAVRTPALHGLWRPRLLLPVGFTRIYTTTEQRFVFLHELAHLRRRDLLLNWIMTALQIVHWFNPLVWIGFARWRLDREIACDAAAIEAAGAVSHRAYGDTMLRLLQHLAPPTRSPGLVGILEDKRQLHRRMMMIANFAPARRPFVAAGLLALLAMVGLTDAQVDVPPKAVPPVVATTRATAPDMVTSPQPLGPHVLFLVNGAETMLTEWERIDRVERGQTFDPGHLVATTVQKSAAAKWQRTATTLRGSLLALAPGTAYEVVLWRNGSAMSLGAGVRGGTGADDTAVDGIARRLLSEIPAGRFDLAAAFRSLHLARDDSPLSRVVLITDGLPTAGQGVEGDGSVTEEQRIRLFEGAAKALPPRIPVHIVLLPGLAGDPGAPGLYWELANATRGALTSPAKPGVEARTHLAFIVDTSGSMRDPNNGGLWPAVIHAIEAALVSEPQLTGVQLLDGDGRFILGRKGNGIAAWLPNTPDTRESIQRVLRRYEQDTVSNPVPGISNALRFLRDKEAPEMRMGIYILGDEYNSSDRANVALERIDALNPRDGSGRRPVTISAIGFPTTIRYQFSMGNTGLRFANLMRLLTHEHDGSFVALPDL